MKQKKFAIILLVAVLATTLLVASACDFLPSFHTHTYSDDWAYDETTHWHEATCEHSIEVSDKAEHNFVDGMCAVCGYEQGTVPHTHTFAEDWTSDNNYHWHSATCEHSTEVSNKQNHDLADGKCSVCGHIEPIPTEGLEYALNEDGQSYSVVGIGTATDNDIVIPATYQGKLVTSIGDYAFEGCSNLQTATFESDSQLTSIGDFAFSNCTSLESIIIPKSVTSIGRCAFGSCTSLVSIIIPDSVTTIGEGVFGSCTSLVSVTIGKNVTSIDLRAFGSCTSLTSITIPDSVTSIGESAFYNCTSLESVTIESGVTSIGLVAFGMCTNLKSITVNASNTVYHSAGNCIVERATKTLIAGCKNSVIPSDGSVTSIGDYAFSNCTSLESIIIPDGVTSIGLFAFGECTSLTSVTISDSVTSIGQSAFTYCTSLESITIPDSVTTIGERAFDSCASLASVTIGKNVTSISLSVFTYCTSLESITVDQSNPVYHSDGNCLIKTATKTLILGCKNSVIPSDGSVTSIGDYAFSNCMNLESITIPDSVTSIGMYAFASCTSLTSVTIGKNVTSIGSNAFSYCTILESITIPDSVTTIDNEAFNGCMSLKNVYFANPNNWNVKNTISASDLSNPVTAAIYLTSTYVEYTWTCHK